MSLMGAVQGHCRSVFGLSAPAVGGAIARMGGW